MTDRPRLSIIMVRHGPTDWNGAGRIQGRSDQPLNAESQALYGRYQVPVDLMAQLSGGPHWQTSPLLRARQTAMLLGGVATEEPLLIEMDWGDWEGQIVADLRQTLGPAMKQNEARGLDFQPPGGESPRDVIGRLQQWLMGLLPPTRDVDGPIVAVTHKGVLRAMLSLATGWLFTGKPPIRIDRHACHWFDVGLRTDGSLDVALIQANIPLEYHESTPVLGEDVS